MKQIYWLILLLALGVAIWGLSHSFTPTSAYAQVSRGTVENLVTGSVTVSPEATSQILSPQDGILKESHLVEGQLVHMGDVLARLDPGEIPFLREEARVNLADVERQLASPLPSEIHLESLKKDLADDEPLLHSNNFPPADYATLQRAVLEQQTLAEQERSELETKRAVYKNSLADYDDQLHRLDIVAPYDGAITTLSAHVGDLLTKAAPLAGIISHEVKIEAEVNQDDIAAVHKDEKADVRFFAYPNLPPFPATVQTILPSSDQVTQRFSVLLSLSNPPDNLIAGLTGEVSFLAGEHTSALRIPRRALFGTSVAVVKDGRVEIRQVHAGILTGTWAEILPNTNPAETVAENEIVLTENLDQFRTGNHVRLTTDDSSSK